MLPISKLFVLKNKKEFLDFFNYKIQNTSGLKRISFNSLEINEKDKKSINDIINEKLGYKKDSDAYLNSFYLNDDVNILLVENGVILKILVDNYEFDIQFLDKHFPFIVSEFITENNGWGFGGFKEYDLNIASLDNKNLESNSLLKFDNF